MAQSRAVLEPDKIYHIWTHANGNENLFRTHENYIHFLEKYKKYLLPILDTYAYCLMPNHIHLTVRIKREEEILMFLKEKVPCLYPTSVEKKFVTKLIFHG
jgi:REP element-mobilizing transposase RayT